MDNASKGPGAAFEQTLEILRQSEELHRLTLSAISDAVFLTDDDGVLHFVGPNLELMFGLIPGELQVGEHISRILGGLPGGAPAFDADGNSGNLRHRITATHGQPRDLLVSVRRASIGEATRLYTCRDVTELLEQSAEQRRLLDIIETAGDFIGIVDANRQPIYINRAGRELVGLPPDASLASHPLQTFHPEWAQRAVLEQGIPAAIEHGRWTGQTALIGADESEIPVSQQILAHRDSAGQLTHLSTICRDIRPLHAMYESQRRRTQQQAAVAELGLHTVQGVALPELLLEAVSAAAALLNAEICAAMESMPDETMRVVASHGLAEEAGQPAQGNSIVDTQALQRLLRERGIQSTLMVPITGKDVAYGGLGVHSTRLDAFGSEDADFLQSVANTLSAAVSRNEETRQAQERQELENQLIQAQKLEALGTLAGGIAHDFNNILYAITGYSELVLDALPEGSELQGYQKSVLGAAQRAAELVKQILSISRHAPDEVFPVSVKDVVKEVSRLMRAALPSNIDFIVEVPPGDCLVLSNPAHLHQVILNLCTNAGQAMRETGGRLTLALDIAEVGEETAQRTLQMLAGEYVRITVTDTGRGVDTQIRDRIFDPFFTTKEVGGGTGLGLSIVNGIVTRYGGSIQLIGEPGEGAVFQVYLPCHRPAEAINAAAQPREQLEGQGESILFVDDEPNIAALAKTLSQWNYEVHSYTSPREALAAFIAEPDAYDILVTDQTMPGLSGLELALACRELRPSMPVILCTGFSHTVDAELAKASGIDRFLIKPITRRQLGRALAEALARQRVSPAPPEAAR